MSNYIIAGEAGSQDLADCEFLGKKLQASTPGTSIHVIAKHSTEWDEFLKKICSGYGFKESSNPIIFTVEGKLIGDKHTFKEHVLQAYSVRGELDKNMKSMISDYDKLTLENHRQKIADGPGVKEITRKNVELIIKEGGVRIIDGFFESTIDDGFEFFIKKSKILSPFAYDEFNAWGDNLEFTIIPELSSEKPEEEIFEQNNIKITEEEEEEFEENVEEELKSEKAMVSEPHEPGKKTHQSIVESPMMTNHEDDPDATLMNYEIDDANIKKFIQHFTNAKASPEAIQAIQEVSAPNNIRTIPIDNGNIIRDLPKDYLLALSPYPLIPGEMVIFSGKMIEGGWLLRDFSMVPNWLKLINIPPQKPVYKDGDIIEPIIPKEAFYVKDVSGNCLKHRGYTHKTLDLSLECSRNSSLKLNTINIIVRHIITECDWEIWFKTIKELDAIGYFQLLPYGESK